MLKKRKKIFEKKIPSKIAKSNFESAYLFSSNLEVEAWVLKGVVFSFEGSLDVVIGTSWDTLPLLFMLLSKTKGEFLGWNGGRGSPKKCGNFRFISNSFFFSTDSFVGAGRHSLITASLQLDWCPLLVALSLVVAFTTRPIVNTPNRVMVYLNMPYCRENKPKSIRAIMEIIDCTSQTLGTIWFHFAHNTALSVAISSNPTF